MIVAVSQYNANPAVTTSSVTIGGIAAVKDVGTSSTNRVSELWRATVPTGTTVDVVVTLSASAGRCAVAVYSADTALTVTAIGNGSAANGDMSATVATTAGGHVIAVTSIHNADTTSAVTWGAVTHNHLSPLMGSSPYGGRMATASATGSGASITATATWTPTAAKLYGVLAVASYATA